MDKRLVVELIPGPAFLIGNALGGIFFGAGLAAIATAVAILLRWRWDRSLPWLAISILGLTVVLLLLGLALDETIYVMLGNTIGSLAFAAIIAVGMMARPTLLERTLGQSVRMTAQGWSNLHLVWISVSLARAAANEFVWRNASDQTWAVYNGVSDVVWIGVFVLATCMTAHRHWQEQS